MVKFNRIKKKHLNKNILAFAILWIDFAIVYQLIKFILWL